jgi:BirA family biotin operon repressor/biotin-[acetyl-CoA-carboxylase] ligase
MFRDDVGVLFMGMIIGVSSVGKLQIQLEDESVIEFGIKEVSFA